jgi:hypothetical protein
MGRMGVSVYISIIVMALIKSNCFSALASSYSSYHSIAAICGGDVSNVSSVLISSANIVFNILSLNASSVVCHKFFPFMLGHGQVYTPSKSKTAFVLAMSMARTSMAMHVIWTGHVFHLHLIQADIIFAVGL